MITVVIGHRGTGKTELMKRLQLYVRDQNVELIDLDIEIEKKIGKPLREMFLEHGEAYFREMERQLFIETVQKAHQETYLVLGAGFDLSVIPEDVHVLWVRRKTDLDGRIFLNRPRLEPDLSPLQEFHQRAAPREEKYRARADEVYLMPEGIFENRHQAMSVEKSILTHEAKDMGGAITLGPEIFATEKRWEHFKKRYSGKGISFFELRDDFLTIEQILKVLNEMPTETFLFSFRKQSGNEDFFNQEQGISILNKAQWIDWPWELGTPEGILRHVPKEKLILSLHEKNKFSDWMAYENKVAHLKFAPEISAWPDLWQYHEWQKEKSSQRSFLPRSLDGRWEWYRLLQKEKQIINFWREGDGSAGDQPSLWAWLMTSSKPQKFAAVLGDPVRHSYTPLEQSDFFHKKDRPVFAIRISRDEWNEAFPILKKLGMTHAAVTSPHKENAARVCQHPELGALNTLYWNEKKNQWRGTSTDDEGFTELIEGIGMIAPLQKEIFVWGGGGTLEMIQKSLPHASYFSSRTGRPREGSEEAANLSPKILIWAAPRSAETIMPPASWNPSMVYDLNYKEDSMGREYAQTCGANYQSGLMMFTAQAQGQRLFWRHCEEQA